MKNYLYNRIKNAETRITDEINACIRYRKAKDINYGEIRERCMAPVQIKSMPVKYKEQIGAILWFTFKREVSNKFLFPVLFEGKLYSKWDAMPEACKEIEMSKSARDFSNRPYPVFTWHFTEGMEAEDIEEKK